MRCNKKCNVMKGCDVIKGCEVVKGSYVMCLKNVKNYIFFKEAIMSIDIFYIKIDVSGLFVWGKKT